eukprot:7367851-Prymnesium_polylepis.2
MHHHASRGTQSPLHHCMDSSFALEGFQRANGAIAAVETPSDLGHHASSWSSSSWSRCGCGSDRKLRRKLNLRWRASMPARLTSLSSSTTTRLVYAKNLRTHAAVAAVSTCAGMLS